MNWEMVSALASAAAAIGTFVLAWVALYQLSLLRKQLIDGFEKERRLHTLEVCSRFENNKHLREAMASLWAKSKNGTDYTSLCENDVFDALTILNYLSGVASGIEQGILIEELAKDYLEHSIVKSVKVFIKGEPGLSWKADKKLITSDGFESLIRVQEAWSANSPAYKV